MRPGSCPRCGAPLVGDLADLDDLDVAAAVDAATAGPVLVPGQLPPLDAVSRD